MDYQKIEQLLNNYFEGTTSIADELLLKDYFSSDAVAEHLKQYQPLFGYFNSAKNEVAPVLKPKPRAINWTAIAAVFVLTAGLATLWMLNVPNSEDLGTFDDPEIAYIETMKALELLAENINYGMESVHYITEYEQSKNLIFKN